MTPPITESVRIILEASGASSGGSDGGCAGSVDDMAGTDASGNCARWRQIVKGFFALSQIPLPPGRETSGWKPEPQLMGSCLRESQSPDADK